MIKCLGFVAHQYIFKQPDPDMEESLKKLKIDLKPNRKKIQTAKKISQLNHLLRVLSSYFCE